MDTSERQESSAAEWHGPFVDRKSTAIREGELTADERR